MRCARRLMLVNICMKFHEDILNSFQVTEQTQFCDGQTDKWKDGQMTQAKTICLPTLKGADIIKCYQRAKSKISTIIDLESTNI